VAVKTSAQTCQKCHQRMTDSPSYKHCRTSSDVSDNTSDQEIAVCRLDPVAGEQITYR